MKKILILIDSHCFVNNGLFTRSQFAFVSVNRIGMAWEQLRRRTGQQNAKVRGASKSPTAF